MVNLTLKNIKDVASSVGIMDNELETYGNYMANWKKFENVYGVIFIALVGQTLSHAMQNMQSLSLTGSHLSVLYFA